MQEVSTGGCWKNHQWFALLLLLSLLHSPCASFRKHCNKDFSAEECFCKYNKSALSYQNRWKLPRFTSLLTPSVIVFYCPHFHHTCWTRASPCKQILVLWSKITCCCWTMMLCSKFWCLYFIGGRTGLYLKKGFPLFNCPHLHHTCWVKSLFKRPLVKKEHLSPEVGHRQDNNVPV